MPPSERQLAKRQEAAQIIARHWEKKVAKAKKIVGYALDGADVDEDGNHPPEWQKQPDLRRRLRVAMDARQATRNAPYYLTQASKVVESGERLNLARLGSGPVTLNIGAINVVQPPKYEEIELNAAPVIEAEFKEKK
jgi:hypothetical protein